MNSNLGPGGKPEDDEEAKEDEEEFDENTPLEKLAICASDDIECEPIEWVWPERFAAGFVTAVVGPRGTGMSFLAFDIAARVTRGTPWPDAPGQARRVPGSVLYIGADDPRPATVAAGLEAAGADMTKVLCFAYPRATVNDKRWSLAERIERWDLVADDLSDLRLVVINQLAPLLGSANDRRRCDLAHLLDRFDEFADQRNVALVILNATDKLSAGRNWTHGIDVIAHLHANATMSWEIQVNPTREGQKRLVQVYSNLNADPGGLNYVVAPTPRKVVWIP